MKINSITLHNFHRLKLFNTGLFCNFIFAFILIIYNMPYIGNIAHISYLVAKMKQVPENDIK